MKHYTRVLARVDLDAVEYNIEMMKKNIQKDTQMMAVIKMDGYGHGAVQIAKLLEPKDYIWGYAVATLDEAILLKDACLKKPVLVLGCIFPDQWEAMIENEVRMTTYTVEMAKEVSNLAVKMGKDAYIHIKLSIVMRWQKKCQSLQKPWAVKSMYILSLTLEWQDWDSRLQKRMPKKSQRSVNCRTW